MAFMGQRFQITSHLTGENEYRQGYAFVYVWDDLNRPVRIAAIEVFPCGKQGGRVLIVQMKNKAVYVYRRNGQWSYQLGPGLYTSEPSAMELLTVMKDQKAPYTGWILWQKTNGALTRFKLDTLCEAVGGQLRDVRWVVGFNAADEAQARFQPMLAQIEYAHGDRNHAVYEGWLQIRVDEELYMAIVSLPFL